MISDGGSRPMRQALMISGLAHLVVFSVLERFPERESVKSGATPKSLQVLGIAALKAEVSPIQQPARQMAGSSGRPPEFRQRVPGLAEPHASLSFRSESSAMPEGRADATPLPKSTKLDSGTAASSPQLAVEPLQASSVEDVPADALRGYRISLALQARRYQFYPSMARELGITGRSEIEVIQTPSLQTLVRLQRTSGYAVLDQAALELIQRAVLSAELPASLRARQFSLLVPVDYQLPGPR